MTLLKTSNRRVSLTLAVCLAVLMQSLYADGFMSASFAGGWPVMLCPEGMPAGFLMSGHDGHHQHGDASGDRQAFDSCPLGKALASDAIIPSLAFSVAAYFSQSQIVDSPVQAIFRSRRAGFFRSRAPPLFVVA